MSAAAVMMVRDEADIIVPVVNHLLLNVDEVCVADNGSTDGTRELLADLPVRLTDDREVGYYQSRKMTAMAHDAGHRGHRWIVPCDADEIWYAPNGERVADHLASVAPDIGIVTADLFDHLPTAIDPDLEDPTARIGWRFKRRGALPKVACRYHARLVIHPGNHGAEKEGTARTVTGLVIRHFSWRTEEQYLRKIRNGAQAYAATDLDGRIGEHWRMWDTHDDDTIRQHFRRWFFEEHPEKRDDELIYDPAPVWRSPEKMDLLAAFLERRGIS